MIFSDPISGRDFHIFPHIICLWSQTTFGCWRAHALPPVSGAGDDIPKEQGCDASVRSQPSAISPQSYSKFDVHVIHV